MKKLILIVSLLTATACDLIVDVDIPIEVQRLTLNAFFIQDSVWTAQLSLNRHILDDAYFNPVDDGLIVIYEQSNPVDTLLSEGNGIYTTDSRPMPGKSYEIVATSPAYGTVRSQSYLPEAVPINNMEMEMPQDLSANDPKISIQFQLKDPEPETNYYQVMLVMERSYKNPYSGEEMISHQTVPLESNDPAIDNDNNSEGFLFKDTLFDGKEISLSLKAPYWGAGAEGMKLIFYLRTLSEDFYRYKITSQLQNSTSGDPFAQPVSVYTNVKNGFGIFGGFSQSVFVYEK